MNRFPGSVARRTMHSRDVNQRSLNITASQRQGIHVFNPGQSTVLLALRDHSSGVAFPNVQFSLVGEGDHFHGNAWEALAAVYTLSAGDDIGFFQSNNLLTVNFEVIKKEHRKHGAVQAGIRRCAHATTSVNNLIQHLHDFLDANHPGFYTQHKIGLALHDANLALADLNPSQTLH